MRRAALVLVCAVLWVQLGASCGHESAMEQASCVSEADKDAAATALPETSEQFKARLESSLESVVDLTSPFDVLRERAFHEVLVSAGAYEPVVRMALTDRELSDSCKIIAVLALQRLPADEYVRFTAWAVDQFGVGQISERVARWVVFPDPRWCVTLQREYEDQSARRIFHAWVRLCPSDSSLVQHILSGERWARTLERRRTGALDVWDDDEGYEE